MRIYVENIDINNINLNSIKPYKQNSKKNTLILSKNTIYKIINNNIYTIKQNDIPIQTTNINNYKCLIDLSTWENNRKIFHIPFNHIVLNFVIEEYLLNSLDQIKLVIEYYYKDKTYMLYNFYFLSNKHANINPHSLDYYNKDIILTFLSLLTNIS